MDRSVWPKLERQPPVYWVPPRHSWTGKASQETAGYDPSHSLSLSERAVKCTKEQIKEYFCKILIFSQILVVTVAKPHLFSAHLLQAPHTGLEPGLAVCESARLACCPIARSRGSVCVCTCVPVPSNPPLPPAQGPTCHATDVYCHRATAPAINCPFILPCFLLLPLMDEFSGF